MTDIAVLPSMSNTADVSGITVSKNTSPPSSDVIWLGQKNYLFG